MHIGSRAGNFSERGRAKRAMIAFESRYLAASLVSFLGIAGHTQVMECAVGEVRSVVACRAAIGFSKKQLHPN